jgi:CRP/FNR family transcriptional regulator
MMTPDRLAILEACGACKLADSFCSLPGEALTSLNTLKVYRSYPRRSTIFMEEQPARGVHLLCTGRVKLSTYSEEGKAITFRIAGAGEALGLSAVISGMCYDKTAETIDECRVGFVKSADFLDFLDSHHVAALTALRQISNNYHKAHMQICSLGLSSSVGDKLVRLLLEWCDSNPSDVSPIRIARAHTHHDIADMIGSSRETVTRLLNAFKDRGLISFSKTELLVPDREKLKAVIGSRHRNDNGHF